MLTLIQASSKVISLTQYLAVLFVMEYDVISNDIYSPPSSQKMASRFALVSEKEIISVNKEAVPTDTTKVTIDIIIFPDLVKYYIGIFMYKYHNQLLPSVFNSFFTKVDQVHSYNTRHASKLSYYLPKVRTNYGKLNIRFQGPMIWNSIDEDFKRSSLSLFKLKLKEHLTDNY